MIVLVSGLSGNKKYHVQVRGIGENGDHTEWSKTYKMKTISSAFDALGAPPGSSIISTLLVIGEATVIDSRTITAVHIYSSFADPDKLYEVTALVTNDSVNGEYTYDEVISKGILNLVGVDVVSGSVLSDSGANLNFIGDDITGYEPNIIIGIREYNNGQGGAYLWNNPNT